MTISVRSKGINPEYTLLIFFTEIIFQFYFDFVFFISGLLLFSICLCFFPYALWNLGKSEIEQKRFSFLCILFVMRSV
jgi:4-amino-4-deoxy-L-arabinose transferase-like glycosyltransferase